MRVLLALEEDSDAYIVEFYSLVLLFSYVKRFSAAMDWSIMSATMRHLLKVFIALYYLTSTVAAGENTLSTRRYREV